MNKLFLPLLLIFTMVSFAQKGPNREKIKVLKVAFITERLNLNSEEAQAFWPVYNDHEDKMESFRRKERNEIRGKLNNLEALSTKEADDLVDEFLLLQGEKYEEQKSYIGKMKKIISAKRVILLMKTEEDFKRRLIKQYRQNRGGR